MTEESISATVRSVTFMPMTSTVLSSSVPVAETAAGVVDEVSGEVVAAPVKAAWATAVKLPAIVPPTCMVVPEMAIASIFQFEADITPFPFSAVVPIPTFTSVISAEKTPSNDLPTVI
ncbi:MAG: hypothetical protein AB7F32_03700 [Victivallaceae bacterium]